MEYVTIGRYYSQEKIAPVSCRQNDPLGKIRIKDQCFLLIYLSGGSLTFRVGGKTVTGAAPCFFSFDERENPKLLEADNAQYICVYFHPQFLNINMTFERLRSPHYDDLAANHDMFLLKSFLDKQYVIPVVEDYRDAVQRACVCMEEELREQPDWYWSCRSRSYFMEVMIALERMYSLIDYGQAKQKIVINNPKLQDALLFIEGHYMERLTLSEISDAAGLNHTTLTELFKAELGMTAMEYLMAFRVKMAKKQLAFTELPSKDVASRCGFQTVQHFSRVFKEHTGATPGAFRREAVQKRKDEMQ